MMKTTTADSGPYAFLEPNRYDLSIYEGLPKIGEANQELQKIAMACGLRTLRTTWKDFTAWDAKGNQLAFSLSFSEDSSPVSGVITSNKQLTRRFLQQAGAPVPDGRTFALNQQAEAADFAEALGFPVVVKPLSGKSGSGVTANILSSAGVQWAINQVDQLQRGRGKFIVEKHVAGEDYRIYVAYGEVLSVVLRTPASVIGDGEHSVAALVELKNAARAQNPHTRSRLIAQDEASAYHLQQQGLEWSSIPEPGQHVPLAAAANISRGGDSTEVLPETHSSILDAAVQAVAAIPGLNQAGVDFLLSNHRAPLQDQSGGICEINTTPALMANQAPVYGPVQPVAKRIVAHAAKEAGAVITAPVELISISLRAQGIRDPQQLATWVLTHARRLDLSGEIRRIGENHLRLRVAGPTDYVSALVTSMHTGNLRDRPSWVRTAPVRRSMPYPFRGVEDV